MVKDKRCLFFKKKKVISIFKDKNYVVKDKSIKYLYNEKRNKVAIDRFLGDTGRLPFRKVGGSLT